MSTECETKSATQTERIAKIAKIYDLMRFFGDVKWIIAVQTSLCPNAWDGQNGALI